MIIGSGLLGNELGKIIEKKGENVKTEITNIDCEFIFNQS